MNRKWFIRALLLLLCMSLLFSVPAYAVEARASERIDMTSVYLSKRSDGDFVIYFSVHATGRMDVIGASSIEIQRNTIVGWVTEYTFTPSNASSIQAENKFQHSATLTYSPLFTEKEYRAVVMIYVKDSSGTSTKQLVSKIVVS